MEGVPLDVAQGRRRAFIPTRLVTRDMEMRADKVREQDNSELQNQLLESQDQLRLTWLGMGQMDGLKKYRELRKDRARMFGILRERELDTGTRCRGREAGRSKEGQR